MKTYLHYRDTQEVISKIDALAVIFNRNTKKELATENIQSRLKSYLRVIHQKSYLRNMRTKQYLTGTHCHAHESKSKRNN